MDVFSVLNVIEGTFSLYYLFTLLNGTENYNN
jgi:hypothetical protein